MASNGNFKKNNINEIDENVMRMWCKSRNIEWPADNSKKQDYTIKKQTYTKKPYVKTPFKDLPEEQKRAWFEKKGIEYKPFVKRGPFNTWTEEEKKEFLKSKGVEYVSKEEFIKRLKANKSTNDENDFNCDEVLINEKDEVFNPADFGMVE